MHKHLPNALTVMRIVLALLGAIALWHSYAWSMAREAPGWVGDAESAARALAAFGATAFVIAAASDWLDGWLARRWQVQSQLGALLDPVADKLLVNAYLIVYTMILGAPIELVVPVAAMALRDAALTFARMSGGGGSDGGKLPVSPAAKAKTALAMIVTAAPLILLPTGLSQYGPVLYGWIALVWITSAMSLATGLAYLRR